MYFCPAKQKILKTHMKRLLILITIGLFFTLKLEAKKVEGRIITNNDTVDVVFNIPVNFFTRKPNYEQLQYKIRYIDLTGKKQTLRPDNANEIQFFYRDEHVRLLSKVNSIGLGRILSSDRSIFLKLEIDGRVKLFSYYYSERSPDMNDVSAGTVTGGHTYTVERYVLQKEDGELKRPRELTFRKDMADYFSDCTQLAEKILNKEFNRNDLSAIVNYYNSKCKE